MTVSFGRSPKKNEKPRRTTVGFMIIVKANADSDRGVMPTEAFCGNADIRFEDGEQIGPAIRLKAPQTEALATILTSASYDEPQFKYMLPDAQARAGQLFDLFRNLIHASELNGEIYTTKYLAGGALWIAPARCCFMSA